MPTLSVIMIVKNEAACIADCLNSVRAIADEMIVVDTGSTDETCVIAEKIGAKLSHIEWPDDFAAARNASIAAATGDWLLHMDADEVLDEHGAVRVRALVDADGEGADAIEVTLANYCNDPRAWRWIPVRRDNPDADLARGFAGYIAVPLLRLFRNGCGFEYREAVHENITESVQERGGVVRAEPGIVIHHYGYHAEDTPEDKLAFYLRLARKKLAQHPDSPKNLHDLAEQALACGHVDEAEAACRRALAIMPDHLESATTLANILLSRGDITEARDLLQLFAVDGTAPAHVHVALAAIECREGELNAAATRLRHVTAADPRNPMAMLCIARLHDLRGNQEHARRELALLHDAFPMIDEFAVLLRAHDLRIQGEELYNGGYPTTALECLVEALKRDPEDPLTHNALGVVAHALGDTTRARAEFERALQLAPGMPDARANLDSLG